MNGYTVISSKAAEGQLAHYWVQYHANARAITQASNAIDRILEKDPLSKGQALSEGLRKLTVPPLTAYYSVDEATDTVDLVAFDYTP